MFNPSFEPEVFNIDIHTEDEQLNYSISIHNLVLKLRDFVIEGWDGEKRRSRNYREGWNVDEHRISLNDLANSYATDLKSVIQGKNKMLAKSWVFA
jgi:hypothetical protein